MLTKSFIQLTSLKALFKDVNSPNATSFLKRLKSSYEESLICISLSKVKDSLWVLLLGFSSLNNVFLLMSLVKFLFTSLLIVICRIQAMMGKAKFWIMLKKNLSRKLFKASKNKINGLLTFLEFNMQGDIILKLDSMV